MDILYPRRCPICRKPVRVKGHLICNTASCRGRLQYVGVSGCVRCSKPLRDNTKGLCRDCATHTAHLQRGYALFVYDDCMRQVIADFKFNGRRDLCDFFAQELILRLGMRVRELAPDCIIPVPMHPAKERKRGFNQATLLAKSMAEATGIPLRENILFRSRNTTPQKTLAAQGRLKNLSGAFIVAGNAIPERILLVDDIYTTGSTMEGCTQVLCAAGARYVYFMTAAIGVLE